MAKKPISIANDIARAMNQMFHTHIVINTSQFYGGEGKLVRMYIVKDSYYAKGQYTDEQIFKSASGLYTCLFMRDLLYAFQGKEEVVADNEGYDRAKEKNNVPASIEYMKGVYIDAKPEDADSGEDDF